MWQGTVFLRALESPFEIDEGEARVGPGAVCQSPGWFPVRSEPGPVIIAPRATVEVEEFQYREN